MHLILFATIILLLSLFIQLDLKKLDLLWHRQSLYLLLWTAFIAVTGTLVNYWWMWFTRCPLFTQWAWDSISSLAMGLALFIITVVGFFFLVKRQIQSHSLLASAGQCQDAKLLRQVEEQARRMFLDWVPALYIGQLDRHFAATFSIFKPVILISAYTLETLDEEEFQSVLIHELAHLKQKDLVSSAFATLIKDLLWFIPPVQEAFQGFRFSQEIQADRMTAIITKKPGALASALLKFESSSPDQNPKKDWMYLHSAYQPSTPGFILPEEKSMLDKRMEYLLEDSHLKTQPFSVSPWNLYTVCYTLLLQAFLWLIPYCHLFMHSGK